MHLIATDGGGIPRPLALDELLLAPGERADVLVRGDQRAGSFRLLAMPYAMDHPMHLHTNPFQVIGSGGEPELMWKDVVVVKANRWARVRVAFRDFAGPTVQSCHILDHEDLGMMATVEMPA